MSIQLIIIFPTFVMRQTGFIPVYPPWILESLLFFYITNEFPPLDKVPMDWNLLFDKMAERDSILNFRFQMSWKTHFPLPRNSLLFSTWNLLFSLSLYFSGIFEVSQKLSNYESRIEAPGERFQPFRLPKRQEI